MPSIGERLRQVRIAEGYSQLDFAEKLDVSQVLVSMIEKGDREASDHLITDVANLTGYSEEFFITDSPFTLSDGSLRYRGRASTRVSERTKLLTVGEILLEAVFSIRATIDHIAVRIGHLDLEPEEAAMTTRRAVGIDHDGPVQNMYLALESAGVIVLPLTEPSEKVDAFSNTVDDQPVIFTTMGDWSPDRIRFSIAHELGHLVLDNPSDDLRTAERKANGFASAFLMPRLGVLQEMNPPIGIDSLGILKRRWGVSIQALNRRAKDVGIISERQYRHIQMQMARWRKREPEQYDIIGHQPRATRQIAERFAGIDINIDLLRAKTHLSRDLLRRFMALHSGPNGSPPSRPANVIDFSLA